MGRKVLNVERAQAQGLPDGAIRETIFEYQRQGGEGKFHSLQDFIDRRDYQTPVHRDLAHQVFEEWKASGQCDPRMVQLIKQIKPHYKIGWPSNYIQELENELLDQYQIRHLFDAVVGSYSIQRRKPRRDAYHAAANQLGADPAECLFVDDKERNVLAAEAVGLHGIVFRNFEDLNCQCKIRLAWSWDRVDMSAAT